MNPPSLIYKDKLDKIAEYLKIVDSIGIDGDIIEIGVYQGGSLDFICKHTARHVIGIDTFEGMPEVGIYDLHQKGQFLANYDKVKSDLNSHKNLTLMKGYFPNDFLLCDKINRFALVHIDVDIYESVKSSILHLFKKIALGGYIVFDDYGAASCPGARIAINEFIGQYSKQIIIVDTVYGQLIIKKIR